MQFVIKGKNLQLTDALKDYAEKKLSIIKKYFDHIVEVDVTLSVKDSKDRPLFDKAMLEEFGVKGI